MEGRPNVTALQAPGTTHSAVALDRSPGSHRTSRRAVVTNPTTHGGTGIGARLGARQADLLRPELATRSRSPPPSRGSPRPKARGVPPPAGPSEARLVRASSFLIARHVPRARNTISCVCRSSSNARGTLPLDLPAPVTEHARKITRQPFGCAQICPPSAGATCCPGDGWGTSAARQAVGFRLVEAAGFKGARPFGTGWRHRSAAQVYTSLACLYFFPSFSGALLLPCFCLVVRRLSCICQAYALHLPCFCLAFALPSCICQAFVMHLSGGRQSIRLDCF